MAPATRPLVWHQLRFALPLAQDAAVGLVERILADASLGRVVLELRASSGQAVWAVGSRAGERLVSVVRELVPGCRVSRSFLRRAVSQAVVVSARPIGVGLATERLSTVVRAILAALASTAEGEELVVQLQLGRRFSPQALGRVEPQGWLELLGLVPVPSLSGERGRRMRAQVGRHRAAVCLRLGVRAASPLRQRTLLQGLLGALRLLEGPGVRLRARTEHPAKLNGVQRPWRAGLELGAGEIVAMAGWPVGELPLPLLGSGHPRLVAPPPEVGSGSSQRVVGASAVPGEAGLYASRLPTRCTTRICWGRLVWVSRRCYCPWRWLMRPRAGACSCSTPRGTWRRTSWRACPRSGRVMWWCWIRLIPARWGLTRSPGRRSWRW